MRRAPLVIHLLVLGLAGGCGGSRTSDLFSTSSEGESSEAGSSPDVAETFDAPMAAEGAADTGGADLDAAGDVIPAADSPAQGITIPCGAIGSSQTCSVPAQICCVTYAQGNENIDTCSSSASDCATQGGTSVRCSSSAQCPSNQVCCGSTTNSLYYSDVSCRATCITSNSSDHEFQFCDPTLPSDCPPHTRCEISTILTTFNVCLLTAN